LLTTTPEDIDAWVTDSMRWLTTAGVPYLLILGAEMPPDVRARVGAALPHATVEVWAGSGHFPHLAHPRRFAGRLAATAPWLQPRSR
jgi:pimeloyl-ACP methyl ester carboxylesterase